MTSNDIDRLGQQVAQIALPDVPSAEITRADVEASIAQADALFAEVDTWRDGRPVALWAPMFYGQVAELRGQLGVALLRWRTTDDRHQALEAVDAAVDACEDTLMKAADAAAEEAPA